MHIHRLEPSIPADRSLVSTEIFAFMVDVFSKSYPGFRQWYYGKVVPGFALGERVIYVALDESKLVGVSILKVAGSLIVPSKICSLYVLPELRGHGIGLQLMEHTLAEATWPARPVVLTLPEERLEQGAGNGMGSLLSFFRSYGFSVVRRDTNRYRQGKDEYVFYMKPQPSILALPSYLPYPAATMGTAPSGLVESKLAGPEGGILYEPRRTYYAPPAPVPQLLEPRGQKLYLPGLPKAEPGQGSLTCRLDGEEPVCHPAPRLLLPARESNDPRRINQPVQVPRKPAEC